MRRFFSNISESLIASTESKCGVFSVVCSFSFTSRHGQAGKRRILQPVEEDGQGSFMVENFFSVFLLPVPGRRFARLQKFHCWVSQVASKNWRSSTENRPRRCQPNGLFDRGFPGSGGRFGRLPCVSHRRTVFGVWFSTTLGSRLASSET